MSAKPKQRLWVVIVIWLVLAAALMTANSLLKPSVASNQVRLSPPVAGQRVQMFADPGSGDEAFVDFNGGTVCTKLDGPVRIDFGDNIASNYYQLTCQGTTGYINAKWVTLD